MFILVKVLVFHHHDATADCGSEPHTIYLILERRHLPLSLKVSDCLFLLKTNTVAPSGMASQLVTSVARLRSKASERRLHIISGSCGPVYGLQS